MFTRTKRITSKIVSDQDDQNINIVLSSSWKAAWLRRLRLRQRTVNKNVSTESISDVDVESSRDFSRYQPDNDEDEKVRLLTSSGNSYFHCGSINEAMHKYMEALNIVLPPKISPGTDLVLPCSSSSDLIVTKHRFHAAKILVNISAVLIRVEKLERAMKVLKSSLHLAYHLIEKFEAPHRFRDGKRKFRTADDDVIRLNCLVLCADVLQNMGLVHIKLEEYVNAQEKYEESISSRRSALKLAEDQSIHLTTDHEINVNTCRLELARLLQVYGWTCAQRGLFEESKLAYCESLNLYHDSKGEGMNLVPILTALGDAYARSHDCSDALFCYSLITETLVKNDNFDALVHILLKVSAVHEGIGDYNTALYHAKKAFILASELTDDDSLQTVETKSAAMARLGKLYLCLGDMRGAKKWCKRSLDERIRSLAMDHPLVTDSIVSMANIYCFKNQCERAIDIYAHCLQKLCAAVGESNRQAAILMDKLGEVYAIIGKFDLAISLQLKAMETMSMSLQKTIHPDIACIMSHLASTYYKSGNTTEGTVQFSKALKMFEDCGYKRSHPYVSDTLKQVSILLVDLAQASNF